MTFGAMDIRTSTAWYPASVNMEKLYYWQGLQLVHFSPHPEPLLSTETK